jgi:hypothetical protein
VRSSFSPFNSFGQPGVGGGGYGDPFAGASFGSGYNPFVGFAIMGMGGGDGGGRGGGGGGSSFAAGRPFQNAFGNIGQSPDMAPNFGGFNNFGPAGGYYDSGGNWVNMDGGGGGGETPFVSPSNDYNTFQQQSFLPPWQAAIPPGRNSPDVVDAVNNLAARLGIDPSAAAAMIQMETHNNPSDLWSPRANTPGSQYYGMTQMGPDTFRDAGGTLDGLTWDQYQNATAPQQIATYAPWLEHYARTSPNNAASLILGGIGSLPPEMQAAIMQATQFGGNAKDWVAALGQGNMSMPVSRGQAGELGNASIGAMNDAFAKMMAKWPQQQIWSNY